MPYIRPSIAIRRRPALRGFGDFTDETPCSQVPAGDPYRKPGNYCATPDGGYTTFNADGSTFMQPADAVAAGSGGSILDKLGGALSAALGQKALATPGVRPMTPTGGMSTTTMIALGGGALLLVVLLSRR